MADYDFQTLMNAASAADKAGDTEGARTLINAARALQTEDVSLLDRTLNVAKRTGTVIADVGEGFGAGVIGAGQGVSELVAMPVDYVFNTDLGSGITEFFEETKEDLGLTPETGVGKFAEGVGTLLPAMIPLVGWMSGAQKVVSGTNYLGRLGYFGKKGAEFAVKNPKAAKKLVGNRARLAGTTVLGSAAADFFVSPDGTSTVFDGFDILPDIIKTSEDVGLQGRDEASRRFYNKIRKGIEGGTFAGIFEAAFPIARGASELIASVPGVSNAAKAASGGIERLGENISERFPTIQKYFTSRGLTPKEMYQDVLDAEAFTDTQVSIMTKQLDAFDKAARKTVGGSVRSMFGQGKQGLEKSYDDLFQFLQGNDDALKGYGAEVRGSAKGMRAQIQGLSEKIYKQIEEASIPQKQKDELLKTFQANANQYIRRLYKRWEDPEFLITPDVLKSPTYKKAVDEVQTILQNMDQTKGAATTDGFRTEATREVNKLLGLDVIDLGIDPATAAKTLAQNVKRGREELLKDGRPLYDQAESLLKERSAFFNKSPNLRELLGEIKNPRLAALRTINDMSNFVAGNRLYDNVGSNFGVKMDDALDMIRQGSRPLVIKEADAIGQRLEQLGYVKLKDTDVDSVFGGSFGSMTGDYVAKEVYGALTTAPRHSFMGPLGTAYALSLQAKGLQQVAKTVYSPLAQVRNALSGVFLVGANGNIMRQADMSESFRLTAAKSADLADDEFKKFYEMTGNLGLRDQNITVNEYRELMRDGATLKQQGQLSYGLKKAQEKIPFHSAAQEVYSGTDNFWKSVGFNAEKAKYANAFRRAGINPEKLGKYEEDLVGTGFVPRLSEASGTADGLSVMSADIVLNTMPTYNRVPEATRMVRRVPIVGNFVAFPSENIRNSFNILDRSLKELGFSTPENMTRKLIAEHGPELGQKYAKELEKQIRAIGAQRAMGYVTSTYMLGKGTQLAAMQALGWDQEAMDALEAIQPYYLKGHQLVPVTPPNGSPEFIDLSYMMPYDFMVQPMRTALQTYQETGMVTDSEASKIAAAARDSAFSLIEPFATESLFAERSLDVTARGGKTSTGRDIIQGATGVEKAKKQILHVLGGFVPGAVELLYKEELGEVSPGRVTRAIKDIPSATGKEFTLAEEAASLFTGLRSIETRLPETFSFQGQEYKKARNDAEAVFGREVGYNDSTRESVLDAYMKANDQAYKAQSKMYALIKAAEKLGLSEEDMYRQLRDVAGLGKQELDMLLAGEFRPVRLSDQRVERMLDEVAAGQNRVLQELPENIIYGIEDRLYGRPLNPVLQGEEPTERPPLFRFEFENQEESSVVPPPAPQPMPMPTVNQASIFPTFTQPRAPGPVDPSLLGDNPVTAALNAQIANRRG